MKSQICSADNATTHALAPNVAYLNAIKTRKQIDSPNFGRFALVRYVCTLAGAVLPIIALPLSVMSQEVLGMSGYTWGQFRAPNSRQPEERNNEILEGAVHQGIDWWEFRDGVRANSFVQVDFTKDTKRFDYNNKLKFAIGTQLKLAVSNWASLGIGGKYEWDRRPVSSRTPNGPVGFLSWSAARSWGPKDTTGTSIPQPLGYSFSTWGQFSYPSSQELDGKNNALLEGAAELAADFWKAQEFLVFSGFVSINYKADTRKFDYNNELEPAIGARFRLHLTDNLMVNLGAKAVNEYRFVTERSEPGIICFLDWSASW